MITKFRKKQLLDELEVINSKMHISDDVRKIELVEESKIRIKMPQQWNCD